MFGQSACRPELETGRHRVAVLGPDVFVDRCERGHPVAERIQGQLLLGIGQVFVAAHRSSRPASFSPRALSA